MQEVIRTAVVFMLSNFTLTFFVLGLAAAAVAVAGGPKPATGARVIQALLEYFILFSIGLGFLYNFVMHVFFGEMAAAFIGWEDSPFQAELGWASLGFSLVGFAAFKAGLGVKAVSVLGPAAFLWGAAATHVVQMAAEGNFAPGNAGVIFYTDLLLPVVGFVLLWLARRHPAERTVRQDGAAGVAGQVPAARQGSRSFAPRLRHTRLR
ncbi:DUF6790 family protein [Arthrobacter sp. GCM10027362]|uniref:DUF6790 family protein n=1 Tax=Arthrobacter sp. GCM10027362 TaxID=3273379 RepID=UPI0036398703